MDFPGGASKWMFQLGLSGGSKWTFQLVIPSGRYQWTFQVDFPSGRYIWVFQVDVRSGRAFSATEPRHLPLSNKLTNAFHVFVMVWLRRSPPTSFGEESARVLLLACLRAWVLAFVLALCGRGGGQGGG